jgi:hypothetical protein
MSQMHSELLKWLKALDDVWPSVESYLLSVTKLSSFRAYLDTYRGLARSAKIDKSKRAEVEKMSVLAGEGIISLLSDVFEKCHTSEFVKDLTASEVDSLLRDFEKSVNLLFFYWVGEQNRNFQFRTFIHFLDLEGVGGKIFSHVDREIYVSFSEDGLRFGDAQSDHIPFLAPISRATLTPFFRTSFSELIAGKDLSEKVNIEKRFFARIRTVQREICLLVDEWEHRNAILAVEHVETREGLRRNPSEKTKELHAEANRKMGEMRNHLACWCLESFCDFQDWISTLRLCPDFSKDTQAELEALDALLLSGLQKIFLPASVSRHQYDLRAADLLQKWAHARIKYHHDDLATHLALSSMTLAAGHEQSNSDLLFAFMARKSYEWRLSFDPSSVLKSFSWSYSLKSHLFYTAFFTVCIARKLNPEPLDSFWLANVLGLLQMPETFPTRETLAVRELKFSKEAGEFVAGEAIETLARIRQTDENKECIEYLTEQFSKWRASL